VATRTPKWRSAAYQPKPESAAQKSRDASAGHEHGSASPKSHLMEPRAVEWTGTNVRIIDQTVLPETLHYLELSSVEDVAEAIRTMRIRGAPAIGVVAALGVALSVRGRAGSSARKRALSAMELLSSTRPTAVNLSWALGRMRAVVEKTIVSRRKSMSEMLLTEALSIMEEDRELCRRIGENGSSLIEDGSTVLTHCNAGVLATAGMGTALAAIYAAVSQGKKIRVIVDETRPLLQGARLTAWELVARQIDVTVVCDSAAAWVMKQGMVDCVLVGADRVASNGDLANKIGSYSLALAAREHGVPFYVACPSSTIDGSLLDGSGIPIEERGEEEVRFVAGKKTVPDKARVYNPAFDIVQHEYVTAIITEQGVVTPPFLGKLAGPRH
jgi:methylthioribose-1-phosphate isomerase